jgi:hypothetical protein
MLSEVDWRDVADVAVGLSTPDTPGSPDSAKPWQEVRYRHRRSAIITDTQKL